MTEPSSGRAVDGRTARRERNRLAALDTAYDLFSEGVALPSMEAIANRSGVSLRSLYRYFSDVDQLHLLALARRAEVAEPLFPLENLGRGTLAERVDAVVEQRLRLYDDMASTIRFAYAVAPNMPAIAERVDSQKRRLTVQLRQQFSVELETFSASRAESVLMCVELLCQFESVERMRATDDLSHDQAAEILRTGLQALLAAPG